MRPTYMRMQFDERARILTMSLKAYIPLKPCGDHETHAILRIPFEIEAIPLHAWELLEMVGSVTLQEDSEWHFLVVSQNGRTPT